MSGFIFKLQSILTTQNHANNFDAQIARILLQNLDLANKNITISQLAKACYTSVSSISRFSTNLGYESFNEMKADFVGIRDEYDDLRIDNSFLNTHTLNQYKMRIIDSFEHMNEVELKRDTQKLTEIINKFDTVYLFATHIPSDIVAMMHRAILVTGKYVELVQDKHEQINIANHATETNLFIIVSLDGTLVMAKEITIPVIMSGAYKVLITQNTDMKFSDNFDCVIPLGGKSDNFTAKYKLMLFIDYFISTYFKYAEENKQSS